MTVLAQAQVKIGGDTGELDAAFKKAQSQMQRVGARLQSLGRSMTLKVTAPLVGVGTASVIMARKFDDSMRMMEGLVGIQRDVLDDWRKDIRLLAVDYGKSATEASEAMFFITSAGLRGSRAMETLEASLKASVIGLGETKIVADAATSAMNAYQSTGLTATRATEVLAAAVREGKTEASAFAPVLGNILSTASRLGISFEQIAGLMAVFSRTGADASSSAVSLQAIMNTLLGTTEDGEKLLASVGLSLVTLREVAAGPNGLITVLRLLDEAFEGNLDQMKLIVPNIRAFRGVMNALSQETESVDQVLNNVANSQGIVDEAMMAATGPGLAMAQAWAAVKFAVQELGEFVLPQLVKPLQGLKDLLIDAAEAYSELGTGAKTAIAVTLAFTAALGPLLIALGALAKTIVAIKLVAFVGSLGTLAALTAAGGGVIIGLGLLVKGLLSAKIAANEAANASEEATKNMLEALGAAPPDVAANRIKVFTALIEDREKRIRDLMNQALLAEGQLGTVADTIDDMPGTGVTGLSPQGLRESADSLRKQVEQWKALVSTWEIIVDQSAEVKEGTDEVRISLDRVPDFVDPAKEAFKELAFALDSATKMEELFGEQFDEDAAKVAAMETAVDDLIASGLPLDFTLSAGTMTLRELAMALQAARDELSATAETQKRFTDIMTRANAIVDASVTPAENYASGVEAINFALLSGQINIFEYLRALGELKRELDAAEKQGAKSMGDLKRATINMAEQGVEAFTEFAQGSSDALREFVEQALADLQRLLIRMLIVRAFESGISTEGAAKTSEVTKVPGFARGGFLAPGRVGIVGEAGEPELISGGRQGVTVTALPASGASAMGEALNITFNVQAADSRDVKRMLEEQSGTVVELVTRAMRRSSTLVRGMGM